MWIPLKTKKIQTEKEQMEHISNEHADEFGRRAIVQINNVRVVYFAGKSNEIKAVDGVNLEIYEEEYVIFFGPSGCGKSTMLNIIAGLITPSAGSIIVDNHNLSKMTMDELAKFHRRETGMIFQEYNLIPTLSVLDNVLLPQFFERVRPAIRKKAGQDLLERLGMDKLEKSLPSMLSGGQQQRVGIARALINDPPILLADEAVGNLDSVSADNVLTIMNKLNVDYKKTIISVTHNPEHLSYADRIFYMKDGKIIKIEINEAKRKKLKGQSEDGGIKKVRTELDLLLQAFPDLSSMQLHVMLAPFKAKMLTAYLLNNFESEEIKNLEQLITNRLLGRINAGQLLHLLDIPVQEGGMGFSINTARKFSRVIEDVVERSEYLKAEIKESIEPEVAAIQYMVDSTRKSILEHYNGELTLNQVEALNKGIEFRIYGKISRKEFQEFLDTPFSKGGAGFNKKSAKQLARKLEIIMLMKFGK